MQAGMSDTNALLVMQPRMHDKAIHVFAGGILGLAPGMLAVPLKCSKAVFKIRKKV